MQLLFDAAINGVPMSMIAEELTLVDIIEETPEVSKQANPRPIKDGMRVSHFRLESKKIHLVFVIRTQDIIRRAEIIDEVAAWAKTGYLTINTRPDKRIYVRNENPATYGSSNKWTQKIQLTLISYEKPYWESEYPTKKTITGAGTLHFHGTADKSYVGVDVTNTGSGAMTNLSVSCGKSRISLEHISIPPGGLVSIGYTDDDLLYIRTGDVSLLDKRTADSDDDLWAVPETDNALQATANQSVSAEFSVRGRWR